MSIRGNLPMSNDDLASLSDLYRKYGFYKLLSGLKSLVIEEAITVAEYDSNTLAQVAEEGYFLAQAQRLLSVLDPQVSTKPYHSNPMDRRRRAMKLHAALREEMLLYQDGLAFQADCDGCGCVLKPTTEPMGPWALYPLGKAMLCQECFAVGVPPRD